MVKNEDPENLDNIKSLAITDKLKEFVTTVSQISEEEKANRAWWEQQVDKYIQLRYGIRPVKTFPWPNCANYVVPQIDTDINRLKPSYVNLLNVSPIVSFEGYGPEDQEPARLRECLFDWRMKTRVKYFNPYVLGIDHMLEQGAVIFKVTWKYSTRTYQKMIDLSELPEQVLEALYDTRMDDAMLSRILTEEFMIDVSFEENQAEIERVIGEFRDGKSEFELTLVEEKDNQAQLTACNIREDLVIPVNCTDVHEAAFIDYKFPSCKNDIKIAMRDGRYENYSDEEIDKWISGSPVDKNKIHSTTSPVTQQNTDEIILHEHCVWYDVNDDGIMEKCIATYPDEDPTKVLRFIELPYEHGQWPYNLVKRELNDEGVYSSRSIGQLDEDFQNGISSALNQAIDNGTIVNTPTVVSRRNTVSNVKNLRYVPGQHVETNGPTTDYEIRQNVNASQNTLFQQAQYLKSWADQRVGNISAGLTSPVNMPGQGQQGQKTAREINEIGNLQSQVQSLDLQVFQMQMADVYYQIDALYEQFGDDDEEVAVTGQPSKRISRKEVQGKFNIVPNGNLENSNPELRAAKTFKLLQALINDPDIKQDELKRMFLADYDVKLISKLMKTPEEKQAEQQAAMVAAQQTKGEAIQTQLGLKVATDNLEVRKAAMMVPFEGAKYKEG